ncbi:MAG: acyl-CoA thioesterase [Clostridia bacterium]|nr:acyl-CoA thioesterase [Clostridia bacterium]
MKDYVRKINYYETDKMGVTHHSNYIRLMEEARVDFLEQIGCGYEKLETEGIISPVIGVECQYKKPTTFGDCVRICVQVIEYKRVRLSFSYTMYNQNDELVFTGKSFHCFLNSNGKPTSLAKSFPQYDEIIKNYLVEE